MVHANDSTSLKELSFTQFVNTFSLMVAAGSVSTAFFFVRYFKADMPYSFYWVLATGVWIIYTIDHLRDGMRLKDKSHFLRHAIHYKYRQVLIPTVIALALFDFILIWLFFTETMVLIGLVMGAFVLLYFLLFYVIRNLKISWLKEVFISLMVVAGMVLYPGLNGNMSAEWGDLCIILIFAILNYANLLLFGYFDMEGDRVNKMQSVALFLGKERVRQWIYQALASVFVLLTLFAFFVRVPQKISATVSVLVMLNILLFIILYDERFRKADLYRFWGDFIYVVPGLIWVFLSPEKFF